MKKFICIFLYILLVFQFSSAFPLLSNKENKILIVNDSHLTTGLPERFRELTNLNISGSAQFTPSQIENIKNSINKPDICIVDLRQESHGFINDLAISFYKTGKYLNNGFTTEETISAEDKLLNSIKLNSKINIYDKLGKFLKEITVDFVSNENNVVSKEGLKYERFAVKDGGIPSPIVIDNFINFIKNKPENQHIHFHCHDGRGRTTTFMVLYQIMSDIDNLSLDQILCYQYNMGGIILTDDIDRAYFLNSFYNYVKENKANNYTVNFSDWIKQ
ncbi:MAG: phosphatase [Clostridium sp.]|nr:phosphatase [Clostridium sp.]